MPGRRWPRSLRSMRAASTRPLPAEAPTSHSAWWMTLGKLVLGNFLAVTLNLRDKANHLVRRVTACGLNMSIEALVGTVAQELARHSIGRPLREQHVDGRGEGCQAARRSSRSRRSRCGRGRRATRSGSRGMSEAWSRAKSRMRCQPLSSRSGGPAQGVERLCAPSVFPTQVVDVPRRIAKAHVGLSRIASFIRGAGGLGRHSSRRRGLWCTCQSKFPCSENCTRRMSSPSRRRGSSEKALHSGRGPLGTSPSGATPHPKVNDIRLAVGPSPSASAPAQTRHPGR